MLDDQRHEMGRIARDLGLQGEFDQGIGGRSETFNASGNGGPRNGNGGPSRNGQGGQSRNGGKSRNARRRSRSRAGR